MAVILNSAMLDSDTFLSSLRFTPKHSPSTLTLTQTKLIWLKLIHVWLNLMMAAILNSPILNSGHLGFSHLGFFTQTHAHLPRLIPTICTQKTFTHSFWLNLMMAAILNSGHLGFSHCLVFPCQTPYSHFSQDWFPPFAQKKPSLIYSESTWWWQSSWILPYLDSDTYVILLSDFTQNSHLHSYSWFWLKLIQSNSNSFILTQLDDGSHLEFCHVGFRHLVFFSQIHSKTLSLHSDSDSK